MTATAIAQAAACLDAVLGGRSVRSVGVVAGNLDLCVFFAERPDSELAALRIATGPPARARAGIESVQLPKRAWLDGETVRQARTELEGSTLAGVAACAGERRLTLRFEHADGRARRVVAECFGPRGFWVVCDDGDRIRALSRQLHGKRRGLGVGACYEAPPANAAAPAEVPVPGDALGWLRRQACTYAAIDAELALDQLGAELRRALDREAKGIASRLRGLASRRRAETGAAALRREAELLLAQPDPAARGSDRVCVPDWYDEGRPREIALDPKISLRENASKRFDRARRLDEGAAMTASQTAAAEARQRELEDLRAEVEAQVAGRDLAALEEVAPRILSFVRRPVATDAKQRGKKPTKRLPYRSFTSSDGATILVGKAREDNDRLTLHVARGNDVWLHVGSGFGGSHVVVRVDRGKTASLECLLDAATLALYFSKARGRPHGEVIYTQRKHVRKRKGLPPGQVEVLRSKTLQVTVEPDRLARLLATGSAE